MPENRDEPPSYKVLATMRYDPWLTNIMPFEGKDSSFVSVQSNWDRYQLDDNDMGYNFPNTNDIEEIRSKTNFGEVVRRKKWVPQPYLIIDKDETFHSNSKEILLMKQFILGRCLFYKQHFQRMLFSAKALGLSNRLTAEKLESMLFKALTRVSVTSNIDRSWEYREFLLRTLRTYKIRLCISNEGTLWFEKTKIKAPTEYSPNHFMRNILGGLLDSTKPTWDIFIDDVPMVTSQFTTFKTTKREHYNAARERMLLKVKEFRSSDKVDEAEILLFNDQNMIMEGSITNIAVKRTDPKGTKYVTPYLTSGCLCGIMRYYLLKKGHIEEGDIPKDSLKNGDVILIFNGVMGCIKGTIRM